MKFDPDAKLDTSQVDDRRPTPAFRCEVCHGHPMWELERIGDVVVTWACDSHVQEALVALQRPHERTSVRVTRMVL